MSAPGGNGPTSTWTVAWWAAWVVSTIGSRVSGAAAPPLVAFGLILTFLASAVLAIVVVERIHRNQRESARRVDASAIADVFA